MSLCPHDNIPSHCATCSADRSPDKRDENAERLELWLNTAEKMLLQFVPSTHDGRNTWLLNVGVSEEAHHQRVEWNRRNEKQGNPARLDPTVAIYREKLLAALASTPSHELQNAAPHGGGSQSADESTERGKGHAHVPPCEPPISTAHEVAAPSTTPRSGETPRTDALCGALERDDLSWDQAGPKFQILAHELERELAVADEHARDYQAEIATLLGNGNRPSDDTEKALLRRTIRELRSAPSAIARKLPPFEKVNSTFNWKPGMGDQQEPVLEITFKPGDYDARDLFAAFLANNRADGTWEARG